jgi:adenylosuccinate lyase
MRENLNRSRGVVFSGSVLLDLATRGVSREQAYELVQRNAMRSFEEGRDFKALLLDDADVTAVLPPAEIERAFDLDEQLKHVDHIFERVFGSTRHAEHAETAEKDDALRVQRVLR